MEAYSDCFYTTGVTYQADNQPTPTTVKGAGVDVSVLPIIGLSGRMDWGVHAYDPTGANGVDPRNGGIVGTVSYDTTRNELDPQYAADRGLAAGHLRTSRSSSTPPLPAARRRPAPCDADGRYELAADGSYAKGQLLNTYVTESLGAADRLHRPRRRRQPARPRRRRERARAQPGDRRRVHLAASCRVSSSAPTPTDQGSPDANFGAAVNGNYGFGDGCFTGTLDATDPANPVCTAGRSSRCPRGDYLVHVGDPERPHRQPDVQGDRRRGHQHRQRRPDRPAGAAAGVRRRPAHRGPGRRRRPTDYPAVVGDGGEPTTCPSA